MMAEEVNIINDSITCFSLAQQSDQKKCRFMKQIVVLENCNLS